MSLGLGYDLSEPHVRSGPQAKFVDNVAYRLEFDALRRCAGAIHPAVFLDRLLHNAAIEEQSRIIAEKLAAAGWNPYAKRNDDVVLVGTLTGAVLRGHRYRNINILPIVAKRNRAGLIGEFKLFLKENYRLCRYVRYAVVTSGDRFEVDALPERYKAFSKALGRFLEEAKRRGQDVYLTTVEASFDSDGTVNLHANIIYRPRCVVGSKQWKEWLQDCRNQFGDSFFHDAGKLRSPNGVIRYVCKPMELLALSNEQIRFVAETLRGKQIVRPVGDFAIWRKALHGSGCKVVVDHSSREVIRLTRPRRSTCESGVQLQTDEDYQKEAIWREDRSLDASTVKSAPVVPSYEENRIVRFTQPMARASLVAEPFAVVRNYTNIPVTQRGILGLKKLERKRLHYVRILAEKNISLEAIQTARSILDLFTVIPKRVAENFNELEPPLRERLRHRLGLETAIQADVECSVLFKLKQILPKERHQWSAEAADLDGLYLVFRAQHLEWLQSVQVMFTARALLLEDDLIPY